ncbi:MAG TPA: glycoside hydrolase family 27 protein [Candidatus Eisenbacteria bacterium]|nr:glycoside hydrolase family 27 protein [Candidatus Eisenbacteria bacterium]
MRHLIAFLALCLSAPLLFATDLSGIWASSVKPPDGHTDRQVLVLRQSGNELTGKWERAWGNLTIHQGMINGNHFELKAKTDDGYTISCEGTLDGDKLRFKVHEPNIMPYELTAVRSTTDPFVVANVIAPPAVKDLAPNGLAKTPPMGWNSWNLFAGKIDDKTVRGMADALVSSGMRDAGYIYLNIDDTWEGDRDAKGVIHSNNKFPDMKALADYVHSKGLKFGIYSSPGPYTCAGYEGSYGHEAQDAKTYAAWGVDYLKYDWCSASRLYPDSAMRAVYQKMGDALRATKRPIVYSLCQYGRDNVWTWGDKVGGNLWRTTGDINDTYKRMMEIADTQSAIAKFAGPGHWNDPDMLEIGNGGMTTDEYRTHMSLWAMFAAPLLAGNDVRKMTDDTKSILLNKEVIAVDQDPLGKQGQLAFKRGDVDYWKRELSGGGAAIAVVNRANAPTSVTIPWADLGIGSNFVFKEVWSGLDVKSQSNSSFTIPPHGVVLLRMEMVH